MSLASFPQLKARLNLRLRNTNNRMLNDAEVVDALTNAYNDPYVYQVVLDNSTTSVAYQAQYAVPSTLSTVLDIRLDSNADGYGDNVDSSAWEQIGDQIYFNRNHKNMLSGKPLIMIGIQQLGVADLIPDLVQDYLLTMANIACVEMFKNGYAGFFLKNSVTMGELINHLTTLRQEAERLRQAIAVQRPITL